MASPQEMMAQMKLMSKVTGIIGSFISAGKDIKKIKAAAINVVETIATDKNITFAAGHIINGIAQLQQKNGVNYAMMIEPAPGCTDLVLSIYNRTATGLEPLHQVYLNTLTQAQLIDFLNNVFNATESTTATSGE